MGERIIVSVAAMQDFAAEVAQTLHGGELLLLTGELGAGKTTFVQGLARALGVTVPVTSPTFTIVSEYPVALPINQGKKRVSITTLVHVDLYRLAEGTVDTDPAVRDVLDRAIEPERITVIEWADRLHHPPPAQTITFEPGEQPGVRLVRQG